MNKCIDLLDRRKKNFVVVLRLPDTSGFWRESICDGGHRLSKDLELGKYKTFKRKKKLSLAVAWRTQLDLLASKVKLRCTSSHGKCLCVPPLPS